MKFLKIIDKSIFAIIKRGEFFIYYKIFVN